MNPRFKPQYTVIHPLEVIRRAIQSLRYGDDEEVTELLEDASRRAEENERSTVMPQDL